MPDPDPAPAPHRAVPPAGGPTGTGMVQAGLIAVAVLYFARDLLIPLALSVLLAFVLAPVVRALRRIWVPRIPAVLISVTLAFGVIASVVVVLGQQVTQLAYDLPIYRISLSEKLQGLQEGGGVVTRIEEELRDLTRELTRAQNGEEGQGTAAPQAAPAAPADEPAAPRPVPVEVRQPEPGPMAVLRTVLTPLLEPLAIAGIVIVLVVFILLYREDLRDRLIRLAGARDLHRTVAAMDDAAYRLSRYFLAQVAMNTAYGVVMAAILWAIGIPQPLLWGTLAGLMRFVPFVGSFIAVAFPLLLALAVDPGWETALWVAGIYLVGELAMGQVFEPLFFGRSTGLSPIAVIAAATFWTWLWGPVGLLLAVPLTVCLVVLGRHVHRLEFLDVMLGDRPPLQPEESFYQRALAGDTNGLGEQASLQLRDMPISEWYDTVALRGLGLAQHDAMRGALDPERLETVRRQVELLIEDLEDEEDEAEPPALAPPSAEEGHSGPDLPPPEAIAPEWREPGAVVCVAGRGRFDGLAAAMLAQLLARHGIGAEILPNEALRPANIGTLDPERVRAICLCTLDGSTSASSVRYFLRRIRRRLPDALLIAGSLGSPADSPRVTQLREEQTTSVVCLTLRDATGAVLRAAVGGHPERNPPPAANGGAKAPAEAV